MFFVVFFFSIVMPVEGVRSGFEAVAEVPQHLLTS